VKRRVIFLDIKDRGNIKWTSLMLVEHRKKLEELKESENDKKRLELDEQLYELFDYKIKVALKENIKVKITYYINNNYEKIQAHIKGFNKQNKSLILKTSKKTEIKLKDIIDINLLS
jgi:hypothetical protein